MPLGLSVGGVTSWALRLSTALAETGRQVGLLVHAEPAGAERIEPRIHPRVRAFDLSNLGPLDACEGHLASFVTRYRAAAIELGACARHPATIFCGVLGDCYGIGAAMCLADHAATRLVGVVHSDMEYDARVIQHYEPVLSKIVVVSDAIEESLKRRIPLRAGDISYLPHGIEPAPTAGREPAATRAGASQLRLVQPSALRLLYAGRLEHPNKRVRAIVEMAGELTRRGVANELTLIGDGPARADLVELIGGTNPTVKLLAPQPPQAITDHLARSDIFVLASRHEGLSVSVLEAMAAGCVPVITRTASGAAQAVVDGVTGVIADVIDDATDREVGITLASAVERAVNAGLQRLSVNAQARVAENFSMQKHADAAVAVVNAAVKSSARAWPADRACAFTTSRAMPGTGSGSVPPEGPDAMARILETLAGKKVVLHGAGRHTLELAHVIADAPAQVVAIADDDESKHGKQLLGWEIIPTRRAHATGATDVVLSSWMHAESLWQRRAEYERQGLTVHRLYPAA